MKILLAWVVSLGLAGCASMGDMHEPSLSQMSGVRTGMTRDDARRLLGTPHETMTFARSGTQSWDYRFQDTWGYLTLFSVIFGPQGTVVGTTSQRLNDGGDHGT
jgi:outer membrane protein assembly factor BamE (lipoprotein component of BamABCDE complex)